MPLRARVAGLRSSHPARAQSLRDGASVRDVECTRCEPSAPVQVGAARETGTSRTTRTREGLAGRLGRTGGADVVRADLRARERAGGRAAAAVSSRHRLDRALAGTRGAGLSGPLRTFVIDNIHDVGRSVESKVVTSADDFTSWLDEVRLGLGLGAVDLLGLSYGGSISAHYALRFPEVVRRVVLLAPAGTTAPIPFGLHLARGALRNPRAQLHAQLHGLGGARAEGAARGRARGDGGGPASSPRAAWRRAKMVPPIPLTDAQWASSTARRSSSPGAARSSSPPQQARGEARARRAARADRVVARRGARLHRGARGGSESPRARVPGVKSSTARGRSGAERPSEARGPV